MNKHTDPNDFFSDVNYASIIDTVKGVYTSDGSMAALLDFERCLDEADLYAFKNWELGELVSGPHVKRYTVSCVFQYPLKLMPDPRGAKRLLQVGCTVQFKKTKIKVPVQIESEDDFVAGTKYPKSIMKPVWLIHIQLPSELLDDVREGSIELADQTIDLGDLDDSYADDLDKEQTSEEDPNAGFGQGQQQQQQQNQMGQGLGPGPGGM